MSNKDLSMTPPLTPQNFDDEKDSLDYMEYFENIMEPTNVKGVIEKISCSVRSHIFVCQGENYKMKGNYIGSLALKNLLNFGNPTFEVHMESNNLQSSLEVDHCSIQFDHLFMKLKKNIQTLERLSKPHCLNTRRSELAGMQPCPFRFREECIDILKSISLLLNADCDKEAAQTLTAGIVDLLKFLGPIYALSQKVTDSYSHLGNRVASPEFHLLHLHLDVRWWCLSILYQIDVLFFTQKLIPSFFKELHSNVDMEISRSPIDICLHFIIWDLISLINRKITKASLEEMITIHGFPCSCSHELAVSVLHLIDHRCKNHNVESFWSIVKEKLLVTLKFVNNKSLKFDSFHSDIIIFPPPNVRQFELYHIWLIFKEFAKLYLYNVQGVLVPPKCKEVISETKLLRTLVLLSISNRKPLEQELRFYLNCCFTLFKIWPSENNTKHADWIAPIWDYFSKYLDSNFMIQSNNLDGFATLCTSPSSMVELVDSLVAKDSVGKQMNSWHILLVIIANATKNSETEWKSIKGRIYSKYFSKKMSELGPVGLYNTNLLFLVFASCRKEELTQVGVKLCELLCSVPQRSTKKLTQVILGLLSTAYLLISRSHSIDIIAERLSHCLHAVVQQYNKAVDNNIKREVGHCIVLYCESIQEIFGVSHDLSLGQTKLFDPALNSLLNQASTSEANAVLSCIHDALSKILNISQDFHAMAAGIGVDIVEFIWSTFQQSLKSLCICPSPKVIVAHILSALVQSSIIFSAAYSDKNKCVECYSTLLPYILESDVISHRISLVFLTSLFQNKETIKQLSRLYPKYEDKTVNLVLKALVENGSTEEIVSAVEVTFNLPGIANHVENVPACPFGAFQMLIQSLTFKYKNTELFQERLSIREKTFGYFGCFEKAVVHLLKKSHLPTHAPDVFRLIGCIFEHGHSLFYVKGKTSCPLANVLQAAILPTSIYKLDKPMEAKLSGALTPILPKVICGLSSLSAIFDPCISRYLKDIFKNYLHRYQISSHPFLVAFNDDFPNKTSLRQLFIETIKQSYFISNSCNQIHQHMALSLLLELLQANSAFWLEPICSDLFRPLLNLLLNQEDNNVRRCITDLLMKVFREVEFRPEILRSVLGEHVHLFVASQLAWYSARVFRILDVLAALNKPLILDALPNIAETIRVTEQKRGSGPDQMLRTGYNNILSRLDIEPDHLL